MLYFQLLYICDLKQSYLFQASDGWYWKWLSKWKKKSAGPSPIPELVSPQSNSIVKLVSPQNSTIVKMIGSQSSRIIELVNSQQVKGQASQDNSDGIQYLGIIKYGLLTCTF